MSSTEHPPAFPSFLKHTTELLSPQASASPSSLPSLPPTRPLPFRAPLRPGRSWNDALFILPDLSHTSSLRSFFLHIPSFSPRAPRTHTQHSLTPPAPPPLPRCPHQPPAALPPMLSTLLSPFKLDPGFRPLFSGKSISFKFEMGAFYHFFLKVAPPGPGNWN